MILKELENEAAALAENLEIVDYSFALPYTYVVLKGAHGISIGVVATPTEEIRRFENNAKEPCIEEFLKGAYSSNIVERTFALATINAISQYFIDTTKETGDILQTLANGAQKVAVVGNMFPVAEKLREMGKDVFVFERNKALFSHDTLSDALEYQLLPEMDVVLATGAVLVNGTIDMILERSKNARALVLMGPTAQILPKFIEGRGVTHLCSSKIIDTHEALKSLKMGTFRASGKYNKRYCLKVL